MNKLWKYIFILLILTLSTFVVAIFQFPDKNLHIIACDVGQGDAILITYKNTQILTDGGPDSSVMDCLGRYIQFWDRNIELVIATHSDSDHITGLIDVLQSYKVGIIAINPIDPGTSEYKALKNEVGGRGIGVVNPKTGMKLGLGLIYLDILTPTHKLLSTLSLEKDNDNLSMYAFSKDANLYSITYKLRFGSFTGLFTGDIPPEVGDELAGVREVKSLNYIKIPHHGSINGITENLLKIVMPKIAVISVGENQWGLPKEEILNMLTKYDVKTLRTDELGDVEVVTDGKKYWVKR